MENKIAIVMSGGGMSCSYGAGAIIALVEKYGLTKPDILIARSGSAGTGSYFVAGQYGSIKNIWQNLLYTKKFANPWRITRILDIDYLVDDIFGKQDILDVESIHNSQINFLIPTTDFSSGEIKYFNNKDSVNWFQVLKATKALALAFNRTINIGGKEYGDLYGCQLLNIDIVKAIQLGASKIIVIDNEVDNLIKDVIYSVWLCLKGKKFHNSYYSSINEAKKILAKEKVGIIYLRPKKKLKIGGINNNRQKLIESFEQGFDETSEHDELGNFILK